MVVQRDRCIALEDLSDLQTRQWLSIHIDCDFASALFIKQSTRRTATALLTGLLNERDAIPGQDPPLRSDGLAPGHAYREACACRSR